MTHQPSQRCQPAETDAGEQVAQLRHVLSLVEQVAGRVPGTQSGDAALDQTARTSSAYWNATSIVQRRFDTLALETAAWAAEGVEALLAVENEEHPPRAAAARLADELTRALKEMTRILRL